MSEKSLHEDWKSKIHIFILNTQMQLKNVNILQLVMYAEDELYS